MLIQVAAQGTGIALGLQDDKFQRLPDRIGSLEYPHHQRAAHATDDSAIDFPCFDAGQAVTQAVGQAGTADVGHGRCQRSRDDIGGNGRRTVAALTDGDRDIGVVGPDVGNDGPLWNEGYSRSQAVR